MSNIEILRCPFCGGEASINSFTAKSDYVGYVVKCYNCASSGKSCSTPEGAIKAWNRRYAAAEKRTSWLIPVLNAQVGNVTKSDNVLEKLKKLGFNHVGDLTHRVKDLYDFEKKSKLNKDQFIAIKEKLCEIFPKQSYPEEIIESAACWGWWWL